MNIKIKINWALLLLTAFFILLINNWKNIAYLGNLFKEFKNLIKKNSKYTEDGDFSIIPKKLIKKEKKNE